MKINKILSFSVTKSRRVACYTKLNGHRKTEVLCSPSYVETEENQSESRMWMWKCGEGRRKEALRARKGKTLT